MIDINDQNMNQLLILEAGRRFGSHEVLYSKYIPRIPASAEREYIRLVNQYMRILKEELEEQLPHIKKQYKADRDTEVRENRRNDSTTDLILAVIDAFNVIRNRLTSRTEGFGLRRKLELLANLNRKLTVKEWKRAIKATLGIDIREDYYLGNFYAEKLIEWVEENVGLIKTIPEDTLDKMRDIVYDGFTNGKTTTRMAKDIQKAYSVSRKRAIFIARDQTAKLNGQIQRAQQMDAGITEYIWYTCQDERVRKSHKELNGQKFSWDAPPENSDGRKCHPGQDYNCRCIGRPVFNKNMTLPLADDVQSGIGRSRRQGSGMNGYIDRSKTKSSDISTRRELDENDIRAIHEYMSFQSYLVNEKLRNRIALTAEEKSFTVQLDSTLKKLPRYKGSVRRSLHFQTEGDILAFVEKCMLGNRIVYDEYISTTRGEIYNLDAQVQIHIPNCTKGRDITSFNDSEQEILYERNSVFMVKGVWLQDGKYHIELEEFDG